MVKHQSCPCLRLRAFSKQNTTQTMIIALNVVLLNYSNIKIIPTTRKLLLHVYSDIVRALGAVRTGMLLFVSFCLPGGSAPRTSLLRLPRSKSKKWLPLLDMCPSSLRRGHANLFCILPIFDGWSPKGIQYTFVHVPNMCSALGTRSF